jgi:2,4-didehydro-3-deoxy-L-rhamnonate hydrolase
VRIGNLSDRLVLITDKGAIDVEKSSAGRFGPDPQAVYERWAEFEGWAATAGTDDAVPFPAGRTRSPGAAAGAGLRRWRELS